LENIFCRSRLVAQCFVYGSSLQPSLVGIIVPDEETVMKWAKENQIEGDFKTLVRDKRLKAAIMEDMARVGREAKVRRKG
jgi:long-chain acyl-CoA synthetase